MISVAALLHVEMLLFLYCNNDLWAASDVHKCTQDPFWSDNEDRANDEEDLLDEDVW